jgi:hypothetical protein
LELQFEAFKTGVFETSQRREFFLFDLEGINRNFVNQNETKVRKQHKKAQSERKFLFLASLSLFIG